MEEKTILDKHQMAEYLQIGVSTLNKMCATTDLPFFRINKRGDKRFIKEEVMKHLQEKYN